MWRDFVWDEFPDRDDPVTIKFLYALWRDFVWDSLVSQGKKGRLQIGFYTPCGVTSFGTWEVTVQGIEHLNMFLYALWRDFVWDKLYRRPRRHGGIRQFLYALWRDFVWDVVVDTVDVASLLMLIFRWPEDTSIGAVPLQAAKWSRPGNRDTSRTSPIPRRR